MCTRLFGGAIDDDAAVARLLRRRRRSVLDYLRGDLARLHAQVAVDDRAALDAHLERIREIERQLDLSAASCTAPSEPASFDPMREESYERGAGCRSI